MFKRMLLTTLLLGSTASVSQAADTRLSAGFGVADCTASVTESCSGQEFFRFGVEQVFAPQVSADLVADLKLFTSDERFNSYGLHLKYAFSPALSSAYIKVGPHFYQKRETTGIFRSESRSGYGVSTAVGWQRAPGDRVGYGLEVWYRTLDDFEAYGVSFFLSGRLDIF